jgi:hypothetical protein
VTDDRIEKWRHWLERGISNDVYGMNLRRFAWKRIEEIARANPAVGKTESYYWEFQFDTYASTQAIAVRRQSDTYDGQVASLGRLIYEISETPGILTREWWIGLWGQGDGHDDEDRAHWKRIAEKAWDDQYAGEVGKHFDSSIARADLEKLQEGVEKVRRYVDQHVAHFDARTIPRPTGQPDEVVPPAAPKGTIPTLNEVHDAIDLIGELFKKYGNLLTAASWVELVPALQHDWERIFRVSWIQPEPEPEPIQLAREWREKRAAQDEET